MSMTLSWIMPAFNHDRNVCARPIVEASSCDRRGVTIRPPEENSLSHSADIAGIDSISTAIWASRGYSYFLVYQYSRGFSTSVSVVAIELISIQFWLTALHIYTM